MVNETESGGRNHRRLQSSEHPYDGRRERRGRQESTLSATPVTPVAHSFEKKESRLVAANPSLDLEGC